ncbi:neprilysin-2 isoform X1 [Tribolium castaneum]|uniref:neprilysin-2 isoform X1 n=2 Tax=Tribolium castaneum TaxID=7070 RepID=UPI0001DCC521|nr:PREDICTED: endothelin-converting enzyme 1-like isoform X1 [Tribolium castaneum]|eukprot:XP_015840924.1 PREDICTED: endothelin-converting enzyme 1-like isoform X1 [Tribolium castaneum]
MINGGIPDRRKFALRTWWKNRSRSEKKIVIVSIVSGTALSLFLLIYLFYSDGPKECTSSVCAKTSMELLVKYIDIKADPCEDFYRFSCGNFLENTKLDDRDSRSVTSLLEEDIQTEIKNMLDEPIQTEYPSAFNLAKKFYRACMNESAIEAEGLKRMKQIFKQIGGWPTLNGNNWRKDSFDWKDAVHKLRQMGINFEYFFILALQRDRIHPDKYVLNIKSPYYQSQINNEIKNWYLEYMVDVAVLMGAERERAREEQRQVLEFLLKLAKISEKNGANQTQLYNPLSLSELQYEFSEIRWKEYINNILQPVTEITYDDIISVSEPLYLKTLLRLLKHTDERIIANFMCWHILQDLVTYLPQKILSKAYDYVTKATGKPAETSRWNMCVTATENSLSTVISETYIKKYLDDDTRTRAISMIRNIKYQFRENLYKLDWLDAKTKDIASEILVSSVEDIPNYNDFIERNRMYEEVEILEDKLLTSALNLDYVSTNIQYGKLRQPVRENFFETPGSVTGLNIVYSPKENALRIPIPFFRGIFYQKNRPEYLNYGALGAIIAHEMYHIITQAEYKGLEGEARSWWSSHTLFNYETKLQCLSNHYGKFIVKMIEHLNASNTRDEDMADLAGMKVAYDTYISWVQENGVEPRLSGLNFSPNQLFWISSAIHHCAKHSDQTLQRYIANYQLSPGQFRVNGALQNLDEFAMDFGCPLGASMNPMQKCRIW